MRWVWMNKERPRVQGENRGNTPPVGHTAGVETKKNQRLFATVLKMRDPNSFQNLPPNVPNVLVQNNPPNAFAISRDLRKKKRHRSQTISKVSGRYDWYKINTSVCHQQSRGWEENRKQKTNRRLLWQQDTRDPSLLFHNLP